MGTLSLGILLLPNLATLDTRATTNMDPADILIWPETMKLSSTGPRRVEGERRKTMTNAERLRRGLPPAKPAKLYNAKRSTGHHGGALEKRLQPAPSVVYYQTHEWTLDNCYGSLGDYACSANYVQGSNTQQAVQNCAATASGQNFAIQTSGGTSYRCWTVPVDPSGAGPCTQTNWAVYDYQR